MLYIGNTSANQIADMNKIYLGNELVFERIPINPADFELAFNFEGTEPQTYTINGTQYTANTSPVDINLKDDFGITEITSLSFADCKNIIKITKLPDTSKITDMTGMFHKCINLISISQIDISSVTTTAQMFGNCKALTEITLIGNPNNITIKRNMFANMSKNGTLYYDKRYDYTVIINELKKFNPTWNAVGK